MWPRVNTIMNRYKIRKMTKKQAHVLKLLWWEIFSFLVSFFFIVIVWLFLWSHFSCIRPNKQSCSCKTTYTRKKTARSAGCPCRNADKKCSVNCGCGKGKLACKNGRLEAIERDNARNLPASAFDRHSAEVRQSMEKIKMRFRAIKANKANRHLHTMIHSLFDK